MPFLYFCFCLFLLPPLAIGSECEDSPVFPFMMSHLGRGVDATRWSIRDEQRFNVRMGQPILELTYTHHKCLSNNRYQICDQCNPRSVSFGRSDEPLHVAKIVRNQDEMIEFLNSTASRNFGGFPEDEKAMIGTFQKSQTVKSAVDNVFSRNNSLAIGYQTIATLKAGLSDRDCSNFRCLSFHSQFEREMQQAPMGVDFRRIENFNIWASLFFSYGTDVIMEYIAGCSYSVYSTTNSQYHLLSNVYVNQQSDANHHLTYLFEKSSAGGCLFSSGTDSAGAPYRATVTDAIECSGSSGDCADPSAYVEWKGACGTYPAVLSVKMVSPCLLIYDTMHRTSCEEARELYFEIAFINRLYDRVLQCLSRLHTLGNVPDIIPPDSACFQCVEQTNQCVCPEDPSSVMSSWLMSLWDNAGALRKQAKRLQGEIDLANMTKKDPELIGFQVAADYLELWDSRVSQIENSLNSPPVHIGCKCSQSPCSNCCGSDSKVAWVHPNGPFPSGLIDGLEPHTSPWAFGDILCRFDQL